MSQQHPITIEVLEIIDAIDRRGSFAKAAEELNKATSAISYGVQKLEQDLDISLFVRQGRRSVLTPAGQLVLNEGREILLASDSLANRAKELATGWEPRIRIGIETLQPYTELFKQLEQFLLEHPQVEVDVQEVVLNGGWEALENDRIDVLIGAPDPVPLQKGFRTLPRGATDLVLVMAKDHPQAAIAQNAKRIEQELGQIRHIITHDSSVKAVRRSLGLSAAGKHFYVQNSQQKYHAIMAGIGIGRLPRQQIQAEINSGLLIPLAIGQSNDNETYLAWKISNKGKALAALIRILEREN